MLHGKIEHTFRTFRAVFRSVEQSVPEKMISSPPETNALLLCISIQVALQYHVFSRFPEADQYNHEDVGSQSSYRDRDH